MGSGPSKRKTQSNMISAEDYEMQKAKRMAITEEAFQKLDEKSDVALIEKVVCERRAYCYKELDVDHPIYRKWLLYCNKHAYILRVDDVKTERSKKLLPYPEQLKSKDEILQYFVDRNSNIEMAKTNEEIRFYLVAMFFLNQLKTVGEKTAFMNELKWTEHQQGLLTEMIACIRENGENAKVFYSKYGNLVLNCDAVEKFIIINYLK